MESAEAVGTKIGDNSHGTPGLRIYSAGCLPRLGAGISLLCPCSSTLERIWVIVFSHGNRKVVNQIGHVNKLSHFKPRLFGVGGGRFCFVCLRQKLTM